MDCAKAQLLISALVDEEIAPADRALLDEHLGECAVCADVLAVTRRQDEELRLLFSTRRSAVTELASRVIHQLPLTASPPGRKRAWLPLVASALSAAAGFLIALFVLRPWHTPDPVTVLVERTVEKMVERPVIVDRPLVITPDGNAVLRSQVQLALATGAVEMRVPEENDWRAMPTGAYIDEGTAVRTPPSVRCEFRCPDGSEVRLNGGTEVCFVADRKLTLNRGQVLSNVAKADVPFQIDAPDAQVTALGTQFDVLCRMANDKNETIVTVLEGKTRVEGRSKSKSKDADVIVNRGEMAWVVDGEVTQKQAAHQLVQATSWVHELLLLKGRDNKELEQRVSSLLAQLGETKMLYLNEPEIRALGDHCVVPLTKFVLAADSRRDAQRRQRAMHILTDLAQPWSIPDLIKLLGDGDGEVRYLAAKALRRLVGDDLGLPAEDWRTRNIAACQSDATRWHEWAKKNQHRIPKTP